MKANPLLLTDFYKISHRIMSAKGTEKIYSVMTPRASRIKGVNEVVFFGNQGFNQEWLVDYFNKNFFSRDLDEVVKEYKRIIKYTLGDDCANTEHIEALHKLGYLPLLIKAVPEGTSVPIRVPMMTIENTLPEFYWLVNFLETLISSEMWRSITAATISKIYFDLANEYSDLTCDSREHVMWQMHNFSYRGMSGNADATKTGAACLLFSSGTDTIPSILYLEDYYGANVEKELVGASVLATEHSIQCQYQDDYEYTKRMLTEIAPSGIVSVVSDGYDYWNVITNVIPRLKEVIMSRDGKYVVRPDSGNPADIICGTVEMEDFTKDCKDLDTAILWAKEGIEEEVIEDAGHGERGALDYTEYFRYDGKVYELKLDFFWNRHDKQYYYLDETTVKSCKEHELKVEQKGSIESLWEIFGGEVNNKGYKVLDSHIGLIYGDAITPDVARDIFKRLKRKGFASSNIVFGVGSYSLGHHTRDTFGMAIKATFTIINGEEINIFKDPMTDNGVKKSQKGKVAVYRNSEGVITYVDDLSTKEEESFEGNMLETVFIDGKVVRFQTLEDVRTIVRA